MADETTDQGIGRRDFARVALGAFGAAAIADQRGRAAAQKTTGAIKLCVQSGATPSDEQLLFLKQFGADYVSVARRRNCERPKVSRRSRSATPMPASPYGTSATPACTTCPK